MKVSNTDKMPLISIIIPMYNSQEYILETIRSALSQTYKNFELIIVDDCSNDKSTDIVKMLMVQDDRIKLIESDVNFGGPARPRNIGIDNSKGEYIAFLDADDVWCKLKLEKQLKILESSGYDIIHTLADVIDEQSMNNNRFKNQRVFNKLKHIFNDRNIIYYTNYININSVLMKKDSSIRFAEDKNLIAVEDWMFWIECLSNGFKTYLLEEKLLKYRIHSRSISNRNSDIGYRKSIYMLSLLLLKKEIPVKHYIFSIIFNVFKIVIKSVG